MFLLSIFVLSKNMFIRDGENVINKSADYYSNAQKL